MPTRINFIQAEKKAAVARLVGCHVALYPKLAGDCFEVHSRRVFDAVGSGQPCSLLRKAYKADNPRAEVEHVMIPALTAGWPSWPMQYGP